MALADKKYTRVFSTTGSDSDLVIASKLTDLERKFNSKDYSESWYRKHFIEMMRYIKWLNGKG